MSTTSRSGQRRRRSVAYSAVVAGVMMAAMSGLALACTVSASVAVAPGAGAPGDRVQVIGRQWVPGPIDLTWVRSQTGERFSLGQATGPDFSLSVTVPANASSGTWLLQAQPTDAQSRQFVHVASFDVRAPAGSSTGASGDGGGSAQGGARAPVERDVAAPQETGPRLAAPAPVAPTPSIEPAVASVPAPAPSSNGATAGPDGVVEVSPAQPTLVIPAEPATSPTPEVVAPPALGSGAFQFGSPELDTPSAPEKASSRTGTSRADEGGAGIGLRAGILVLAIGGVGLFAAFTVAEARRKPVKVKRAR